MTTRYRIAKNTLFQLIAKFFTASTTIVITILVTREYGSGFGSLIAILSYIGLFFVFTDFGINSIFVKEVVGHPEKEVSYFKNLLGLRIVTSIFVVFVALAVLAFTGHPPFVKVGIIFALLIIVSQGLFFTSSAFFQAKERYDLNALADVLGAFVTLALAFLAVSADFSLLFIVVAYILGAIVRALIGVYIASSKLGTFGLAFDIVFWRRLIITAFPIGLVIIFAQINANVDKQIVFLANYKQSLNMSGETAAAIYGLAYRVFEVAIVLPTFLLNSAYPIMVEKKNEGIASLIAFSRKIGFGMTGLGLVILVILFALTPLIISILGGGEFSDATVTTRILLLGFPIFFVTPVLLWLLVILDKQKQVAFVYGLVSLFNLAANLFLVPRWGYNAAAWVTILSELFIFLLTFGVLSLAVNESKKQ